MQCRVEGYYRAKITDYGLKEMDSGAVAITIRATLIAHYEQTGPEECEWVEMPQEQPTTCEGDIWIIGNREKGNRPNEIGIQSLVNHVGWDAELASVVEQTWKPSLCVVSVKANEYKGRVYHNIAFVNAWNYEPRSMLNKVAAKRARELEQQYGETLRSYRPEKPVVAATAQDPNDWQPAPQQEYLGYPPGGEDIPFAWIGVLAIILPLLGALS